MANDHYISRFLTRRWEEVPGRKLRFFDLDRDLFDRLSSESLFAKADINTKETETFLNRFIETPVSSYLARVIGDGSNGQLIDTGQKDLYRALVSLVRLQVQRLKDADGEGIAGKKLNDLVSGGETFLDQIAAITSQRQVLLGLTLPPGESLYFTNLGAFVIPLAGEAPAEAVPLSPRHYVCLAPPGDVVVQQLRSLGLKEGALSAFSIGVGANVKKVVIPPARFEVLDRDPLLFKKGLLTARNAAQNIFDLVGKMSDVVGLPGWHVTKTAPIKRGHLPLKRKPPVHKK
jgi:hypothetical protein